jgi:calcineurin-like phosphoesterase family protein
MHEKLIENWNKTVKRGDSIYFLGDFGFGHEDQIRKIRFKLNGKIHMIWGNHDYKNNIDRLKDLFSSISDLRQIKWFNQKIVLCHYPLLSWNARKHGSIMLHGHCHGNLKISRKENRDFGKILDIGTDCFNFTPISFEEVMEIMKDKPISSRISSFNDHHSDDNEI